MAVIASAGDQDQVGAQGAGGLDHLIDLGRAIHGDDQGAGRSQAAGAEHVGSGGVAVIDLMAVGAAGSDRGRVGVQGDEALTMFGQKLAHQPSDAPETDDQHDAVGSQDSGVGRQALGLGLGDRGGPLHHDARQDGQQRDGEHAEGGGQHGLVGQFRRRQALDQSGGQDDEGELAGRAEDERGFDGRSGPQPPGAG
ncbi:hypothetical protein D3C81_1643250 [compost metagenome]